MYCGYISDALSGLTCTHENAMVKAGAQAWAAEAGIALIFPDTSPRGEGVSDDEAYDLGQGAGFYVNATQDPWAPHFQMWDYISAELPSVIAENFNIDMSRQSITGHSMGGHGASEERSISESCNLHLSPGKVPRVSSN